MKKYIFIALGGMFGAMLRYKIEHIHIYHYKEIVPINTLMINISGSFVLALVLTIAFEIWQFSSDLRLGIATGFLGAYTTFSTMCKETVNLMKQGNYYSSISYIGFSTMLGLAAAYFGIILAREIIAKLVKENDDYNEENLENVSGEDK
ncbi:fluoride efflux transporter CrcB [Clostridium scatologenes]|uniref:Fluoride-specific ion channel FluC n=1 Tax=Clostridium scatologenes TaxID=1548 RepID=A0A0E3MAF5_CLOSL|nr:fluoride efflux transporter CrcB [Clostridium scatologenes]AKA70632.1 CrcB-related protein [Clostridium scatologenes]